MNEALALIGKAIAVGGDQLLQLIGKVMDFLAENPDLAVAILKGALAGLAAL